MTASMTDSGSELLGKARHWLKRADELDELLRDPEKVATKKWDAWDAFKPTIVEIRREYHSLFIKPLQGSEDEAGLHRRLRQFHNADDALLKDIDETLGKDDQRIEPIRSLVDAIIKAAETGQQLSEKDQELSEKDQQLSETKESLAEYEKQESETREQRRKAGQKGGQATSPIKRAVAQWWKAGVKDYPTNGDLPALTGPV